MQSKKPTDSEGNDAVIRSGKLSEGTYYLVETESPGGYNSISGPVKITITQTTDGILTMSAEIEGDTIGNDMLVPSGKGVWKLSVQNTAGYELPSTGGFGTEGFLILGGLLTIGAAGLLIRRKIKQIR